jgi:putative transposase
MYLLAIMDVYSRLIIGWSLSNTMEAEWVVNTLNEAVNKYGKPEIINSDQGSQFTSEEYVTFVKTLKTVYSGHTAPPIPVILPPPLARRIF